MKMNVHLFLIALCVTASSVEGQSAKTDSQSQERGIEPLQVAFEDNGYLKQELVSKLREEQLRIKATSAYEYALPIVGLEQWHQGFLQEARHGDWLVYDNRDSKIPIITANTTTPYVVTFLNLAEASYYIEIPAGPIGGLIIDIYQTPQSDLGIVGPDKGKGGKYLLLGPESQAPVDHDADFVVKSKSNLVLAGTRIIGLQGEEYNRTLNAHRVYEVGGNREGQKFIDASTEPDWMGNQSRASTSSGHPNRTCESFMPASIIQKHPSTLGNC